MRIAVNLPTRNRLQRAADALGSMLALESGLHEVRYAVAQDADDADAPECVRRILDAAEHYPGAMDRIVFREIPTGLGKIHACNAGTPPHSEWDVLVMGSDDMRCVLPGWDDVVARDMEESWPNLDGCLWYADGNQVRICTYPVMGVNWHAKTGAVYWGGYRSLFADDDAMAQAQRLGRISLRLSTTLFRHEHPAYGGAATDALYARNEAPELWREDQRVFLMRQARNFDWPPVRLSILVCSITERRDDLRNLLASLNAQINALPVTGRRMVETHVLIDGGAASGGLSIGAKRQRLLGRAVGEYVAFIDDDDAVAPDYVSRILAALETMPDCVGFTLRRIVPRWVSRGDGDGGLWVHSKRFTEHAEGERPINHLNPVRRELALQAGFRDESWGEDSAYAARLAPLLAGGSESFIDGPPMYFYMDDPRTSAARPLRPKPVAATG